MRFVKDQVVERLKNPINNGEIVKGQEYESTLRIYTEPKNKAEIKEEQAFKDVIKFLRSILDENKAKRIEDFILYPLSVCGITSALMSDIYKVFNAGNSYFEVKTVKKNGGDKLNEYLDKINVSRWIETTGRQVLSNKPNTIVVVDKNEEGEPYLIAVDNNRIIDYEYKPDGINFEYVAFKHSETVNDKGETGTRVALYDEERYWVLLEQKGEYKVETSVEHNVGYTPARNYLSVRLNSNGDFNRKSPLSLVIGTLREWFLFNLFKFYTDHYAPFPIVEMVRQECAVDNCNKGVVTIEETYTADGETKVIPRYEPCKICSGKKELGVGAKIMIDPQTEGGDPSAGGKFRFISNDIKNLEYLKDKLTELEDYIKLKVVGTDGAQNKEAVNKDQVRGSFESKTNILLSVKNNLDELHEWVVRTIALVGVGDKPITVNVNYGTEWYLVSEEELQSKFNKAKESGLPAEEVDLIYKQLIETKYKGNPSKIERLKIINELNPCPYSTTQERLDRFKAGVINREDLVMSENLTKFVKLFELDNGNLLDFGENLDYKKKVNSILTIIKKYANEQISSAEPISGGKETNE